MSVYLLKKWIRMNHKKAVYRNILTFFVNNKDKYTWYIKPIQYILEVNIQGKHWNDFLIVADDEYEAFYIIHQDRKLKFDYSDSVVKCVQTKLKHWISSEPSCGICREEKQQLMNCAKCTGSYCRTCFHKIRQGRKFKCAFCRTFCLLGVDEINF